MKRQPLLLAMLVVIVLIAAALAPSYIYGGAKPVGLKPDPLSAAVAAALQNPGTGYQPIENRDYVVNDTSYFSGGQWVVVSTKPIGSALDPAKLVFKKDGADFQLVLGPSNFFQAGDLTAVPDDVATFLLPETQR